MSSHKDDSLIVLSDSSIITLPDMSEAKQVFIRNIYLVLTLINTLLGGYMLYSPNSFRLEKNLDLLFFIKIYTFVVPIAAISAIVSYMVIFAGYKLLRGLMCIRRSEFEDYGLINSLYVVFVIKLTILHVIAIPFGMSYITAINSDKNYKDIQKYFLIYIFLIGCIAIGVMMFISFFYIVFCVHFRVTRKQNLIFTDDRIKQIELEIKNAQRVSGIHNEA
jgi:hypothetical protein